MKKVILFFTLIAIPFLIAECFFNSQASNAQPVITVTNAFAYPTLKGITTGAAYMDVTNSGTVEAVIVGAETPVAARAELHDHIHEGGIMKMRHLEKLAITPGETKSFKPGSLHVMLFEMNRQLDEGAEFPLTLTLEGGEKIPVTVKVEDRE